MLGRSSLTRMVSGDCVERELFLVLFQPPPWCSIRHRILNYANLLKVAILDISTVILTPVLTVPRIAGLFQLLYVPTG